MPERKDPLNPRNHPRRERPAEPGQRFMAMPAWQKDEFQEEFMAKVAELGLVLDQDIILRMDPIKSRGDEDGEKILAKVTFTARMGNKKADILEFHDIMNKYDQDYSLPPL